jgi:ABC-type antimicrobial peptide transport system permease subunit
MLELFGWNVGMTLFETIVLVLGALVFGAIAQYIGRTTIGYEWIFTAAAALVGGWLGSEAFGTDVVARLWTGGAYIVEPRPI